MVGGISSQDVLINEIEETIHDYFINHSHSAFKGPKIEKYYFENAVSCVGALYNFFFKMENLL